MPSVVQLPTSLCCSEDRRTTSPCWTQGGSTGLGQEGLRGLCYPEGNKDPGYSQQRDPQAQELCDSVRKAKAEDEPATASGLPDERFTGPWRGAGCDLGKV